MVPIVKRPRRWRTRPSVIISKIFIPIEDEGDEFIPKWERMLKKEKTPKYVRKTVPQTQKILEERLIQDINEAKDYSLIIEPANSYRELSYHESFIEFDESFNTPPLGMRELSPDLPVLNGSSSSQSNLSEELPRHGTTVISLSRDFDPSLNSEDLQISVESFHSARKHNSRRSISKLSNHESIISASRNTALEISAYDETALEKTKIDVSFRKTESFRSTQKTLYTIRQLFSSDESVIEMDPYSDPAHEITCGTTALEIEKTKIHESFLNKMESFRSRKIFDQSRELFSSDESVLDMAPYIEPVHESTCDATAFEMEKTSDHLKIARLTISTEIKEKKRGISEPERLDCKPWDMNDLLGYCEQQGGIKSWSDLPNSIYEKPVKLGEGAYGEVFEVTWPDGNDYKRIVLKVMPFQDEEISPCVEKVNGDNLKFTSDVLQEVILTKELSGLKEPMIDGCDNLQMTSNFIRLFQAIVVKGPFPEQFLQSWDIYEEANRDNEKKVSQNQRPDEYSSDDRLFIIFALAKGGDDLEIFEVNGEAEGMSIFFQVALSLHVAEKILECEHRDLHISNILVSRNIEFQQREYIIDGIRITLKTNGIKADIIDYSNSRIAPKKGWSVFADLSKDDELFEQPGRKHKDGSYQADVYRKMKKLNENNWETFNPKTNVYWLHYLIWHLFLRPKPIVTGVQTKRKNELKKIFAENKVCSFRDTGELLRNPDIAKLRSQYLLSN